VNSNFLRMIWAIKKELPLHVEPFLEPHQATIPGIDWDEYAAEPFGG